jgi:hypothetical protein
MLPSLFWTGHAMELLNTGEELREAIIQTQIEASPNQNKRLEGLIKQRKALANELKVITVNHYCYHLSLTSPNYD